MSRSESSRYWQQFSKEGGQILNVREEIERRRSRLAGAIEWIAYHLARPSFFAAILGLHLLWVILNMPMLTGMRPFDPYPFYLLATIASVEAPLLSLLILMAQHRDARIGELRSEVHVQVSLYHERELSAALRMLRRISDKVGVEPGVDEQALEQLQDPIDPRRLMEHVRRHLDASQRERLE